MLAFLAFVIACGALYVAWAGKDRVINAYNSIVKGETKGMD